MEKLQTVQNKLPQGLRMQAIAFRADSKGAWHAAVTAGLANLRARSCGINPVDALRAKLVSGLMALPLEGAGGAEDLFVAARRAGEGKSVRWNTPTNV